MIGRSRQDLHVKKLASARAGEERKICQVCSIFLPRFGEITFSPEEPGLLSKKHLYVYDIPWRVSKR